MGLFKKKSTIPSDSTRGRKKSSLRWYQEIIDTFADAYGWSKNDILDLYIAEIWDIIKVIEERKTNESTVNIKEIAMATWIGRLPKFEDVQKALKLLDTPTLLPDLTKEQTREGINKLKTSLKR